MLAVGLAAWIAGRDTPSASAAPTAAVPASVPPPPPGRLIALTVDDGYAPEVVAGYVEFARRTGVHLTFSPNGTYARAWDPHAAVLRPLIEAGQVQIMNHTFSHPWLTRTSAGRIREELERNERWVAATFATTSRPFWRPPYGAHDPRVDAIAKDAGYPTPVLWTGSYGDATTVTPQFLLSQARRYLTPGTIIVGHANHPTVLGLFDQITAIIRERGLRPVTLNEFFAAQPH
ncbi:polysaccharide deacetylase family protein [Actinomycetospora chiangmaiensis]|uniref:polysaccharide deacetylase family protein n=1 Tax=Actinomycetospora chiangmaiensis TaxID=402650 RepID=UPI000524020B|nr:polysaccharide deacetylase family protein [Actinomycetospora chiangmaiensis]